MIINITCPNCNFSKQVPSENIPAGIKNARCPRCGKTFEIPGISEPESLPEKSIPPEPLPQEIIEQVAPPPLPDKVTDVSAEPVDITESPAQDDVGYFAGLLRIFTGVLFSPTEFFRGVRGAGLKDALIFGILTGAIGAMLSFFWQFIFQSQEFTYITKAFPEVSLNDLFLGLIICSPLLVIINTLVVTLVIHFCLTIVGGTSREFEGTLKVMLYSNAVSVFSLFPYIGGVISFIWGITIIITGLREIHETSNGKAIFSLLLPLFFLFILSAFAAAFLVSKLL